MPETNITPAYRLVSRRLILRCWNPIDADLLTQAIQASVDHLKPWMPWAHLEPTTMDARIAILRSFRSRFDRDEDYVYGIFNLQENQVLGGTGLHTRAGEGALEIGYWIHKDFTHQGYATETAAVMTRAAFEIYNVNRVEIHCDPMNFFSAAVPRKLGFTHDATLRQRIKQADGSWRDSMVWSLLAADYPESLAASYPMTAFDAANRPITVADR